MALLPCATANPEPQPALCGENLTLQIERALAAVGFEVVPAIQVLHATAFNADLPDEQRARLALDSLDAAHVVLTRLRWQGALHLNYQVFAEQGPAFDGQLSDGSATVLAGRLAQALIERVRLRPGSPSTGPTSDPIVTGLLAHADDFLAQECWADAEALYHAAVRLSPQSTAVRSRQLQCLLHLKDPRTTGLAQQLLADAHQAGDLVLAARAHLAMARHLHRDPRASRRAKADHHLAEAWRLHRRSGAADEPVDLMVWQAQVQADADDPAQARASAMRAEAAAVRLGLAHELSQAQQCLAVLDIVSGDLLHAQQGLQALADEHLRQGQRVSAAEAMALLAHCSYELGLTEAAESQAGRAVSLLAGCDARGTVADVLALAALVFAEHGRTQALADLQHRLEQAAEPAATGASAPGLALQGLRLLWQGRAEQGRSLIHGAFASSASSAAPLFARQCGRLLLRLSQSAGQWLPAKRTLKRLTQWPGQRHDPMLQASLQHAKACDAWRQGRRKASMVMLLQLIDEFPLARAQAAARMDLAWMLLEDGEADRAEKLLAGCGAWRRDSTGLAAQARLLYARGQLQAASTLQMQALQLQGPWQPRCHQGLAEAYAQAAVEGQARPLPALPRWLSLSWLPD